MTPEDKIANWERSDILTLGNHFHGEYKRNRQDPNNCNRGQGSNHRVGAFYLGLEDLRTIKLFDEDHADGFTSFTSFEVYMALNSQNPIPGKMTFLTILKVTGKKKIRRTDGNMVEEDAFQYLEMWPGCLKVNKIRNQEADSTGGEEGATPVPLAYMNNVTRVWEQLRMELIDDSFLAIIPQDSQTNASNFQKLNRYVFSPEINKSVFRLINGLITNKKRRTDYIGFHLGLDMNKELDRSIFSFTPVLEVNFSSWNPREQEGPKGFLSNIPFEVLGKEHTDQLQTVLNSAIKQGIGDEVKDGEFEITWKDLVGVKQNLTTLGISDETFERLLNGFHTIWLENRFVDWGDLGAVVTSAMTFRIVDGELRSINDTNSALLQFLQPCPPVCPGG